MLKEKGAVLTHNHPGSTSFSPEDFETCNELKARNMRATSKYFDYEIKIDEKLSPEKKAEVLKDFKSNKNKWKKQVSSAFSKKNEGLSKPIEKAELVDRYNQVFSHLAWKETAKKHKEITYKRWIR